MFAQVTDLTRCSDSYNMAVTLYLFQFSITAEITVKKNMSLHPLSWSGGPIVVNNPTPLGTPHYRRPSPKEGEGGGFNQLVHYQISHFHLTLSFLCNAARSNCLTVPKGHKFNFQKTNCICYLSDIARVITVRETHLSIIKNYYKRW